MSQSLRDNEGNYLINGRKYKSVTTILKEEFPKIALDAWKERTPDWPVKARPAYTELSCTCNFSQWCPQFHQRCQRSYHGRSGRKTSQRS